MTAEHEDHLVHEAVGPSLSARESGAVIAVGVNSLLVLGVVPVLLGALVDEHRLSNAGIGHIAMLELLGMGLATAAAGAFVKPARLRAIGAACSLILTVINVVSAQSSGLALYPLRVAAGGVEGILLWITVSMISRTLTPERWAGVFFAAQTFGQLVLAIALAVWILPLFGATGGFIALAAASLMGVVPAFFTPDRFAPLPVAPGESGAPPLRGWLALGATVIFVASSGAVSVYLQPLAHQAGLGAGVARSANWISLVAQVCGGALAVASAGRVKYFTVFVAVSAITLAVWYVFGHTAPGWLFIAANAVAGLTGVYLAPFLVPFTIEADPSRRAALQSGAAQLLGGALGPWLASWVVSDRDVRGVLWLGAGLMLAGLASMAALRFTRLAPGAGRA
ncbi:MAG TPA: MFS transporter [Caulobacteraceae bacterium]